MLSRVANSVYWMNRYVERAENVARFLDVNINLTLDLGDTMKEQWGPLVDTTGDRPEFERKFGLPTRENVWEFLTFDLENANSIVSCLRSARENARSIREIIPSEMWEELNKAYLLVRGTDTAAAIDHPHEFLGQVKVSSQLVLGMTDSAMSRGEAWHFAQLGRLLERADKTSRILDVKYFILLPSTAEVGTPLDLIQWSALLKSASAFQMYHRSRGRISPSRVADFLILDREFARAMRFCLNHAERSLHAITGSPRGKGHTLAEQQLNLLGSQFDFAYIQDIIEEGLHEFVDRFQTRLNDVDDAVYQTFFAARPVESVGQEQTQSQG
jgi:uncharacterized alpha-E superfamily protein